MGGIAKIARQLGHTVTGSDANVYPPMSTQLNVLGIELLQGYDLSHLLPVPDQVIIGNTISRGNPELEFVLSQRMRYFSGPEWLYQEVLHQKHVLAVSGTHGKTTTTAILSCLLDYAGYNPGFLIGGVAENFGTSARLTDSEYFVIEADEYDTAFSDKRSKFLHYHPETLIMNNIEFDHADIFQDISDIRRQFHHLIRALSEQARVIYPADDEEIEKVLAQGCYSQQVAFAGKKSDWHYASIEDDYTQFTVLHEDAAVVEINWSLLGEHNARNALAAIIAAEHVGISPETSRHALTEFLSVKRRLQCIMDAKGIRIYDDFAHHPSAIQAALQALRSHVGESRIIAVMEPRSNTMKMGTHAETLANSLTTADLVMIYQADTIDWNIAAHMDELGDKCCVLNDIDAIIGMLVTEIRADDVIVIMSNGGFGGIHEKAIKALNP